MNTKLKILLLAGNTLRARAYAQQLAQLSPGDYQIRGLLYGYPGTDCSIPALDRQTNDYLKQEKLFIPNFEESLETTFSRNHWHLQSELEKDVNADSIIDLISKDEPDIVIFAGYGGQLLGQNHFYSKAHYLHLHPGRLPAERGSTTIYYSILNKRVITVTAFYMTAAIDQGENIVYGEYAVPSQGVNIDFWLDNVVRADCLLAALEKIATKSPIEQPVLKGSEEYYIIHPVLKHIALLSLKNG